MMNTFKLMKAALLLTFCLLLFGCNGAKEINDMAIISGAAVDLDPQNGNVIVTAEIVNKSSEAVSGNNVQEVISAEGRTIADAIENCNYVDSRDAYWSHAKTFVISKAMAEEEGVGSLLDYVLRNYKTRISINLLVADTESASDILELTTSSTNIKFLDLQEMLITDSQYSGAAPLQVYQAIDTLISEGVQLTVPVVTNLEEMAVVRGTAVFRSDKLVGYLNQEETMLLLFLQNRVEKAHVTVGGTTFRVTASSTSLSPEIEDGQLKLRISIDVTASLSQLSRATSAYDYSELAGLLELTLEEDLALLIEKAQQEFISDIFGFGKKIKDTESSLWGEIGASWDSLGFPSLKTEISCNVKLKLGETY